MPRGSRGGSRSSPFGSKRHSSNSAAPQAKPQQQSVPPKPSQAGSGLGASMARGAAFGVGAGVAGEAVRGMMGTSRYDSNQEQQQPAAQQAQQNLCADELNKFLECAQTQNYNLSLCTPFNDFYMQCKKYNGLP